jgi:DNA-binding response OmpR family regulator
VKQLALTHHDPNRDDDAVDQMIEEVRSTAAPGVEIFGAAEGSVLKFEPKMMFPSQNLSEMVPADKMPDSALVNQTLLMYSNNEESKQLLKNIGQDEELFTILATDPRSFLAHFKSLETSLLVLEADGDDGHFGEICRALNNENAPQLAQSPILVLSDRATRPEVMGGLAADWLSRPFSLEYVKTRIHSSIIRGSNKWIRAELPQNEEERLASLCSLNLLDTPNEERFDSITEEAAKTFDMPIALVSLVDRDRQWFKSAYGVDAKQTSRDSAFCAHAILHDRVFIVQDTHQDSRFAENVLVVSGPRIRFYAGCPLKTPDGFNMGTLCLIDSKPREFSHLDITLLQEYAKKVESEVQFGCAV